MHACRTRHRTHRVVGALGDDLIARQQLAPQRRGQPRLVVEIVKLNLQAERKSHQRQPEVSIEVWVARIVKVLQQWELTGDKACLPGSAPPPPPPPRPAPHPRDPGLTCPRGSSSLFFLTCLMLKRLPAWCACRVTPNTVSGALNLEVQAAGHRLARVATARWPGGNTNVFSPTVSSACRRGGVGRWK